MQYNSYLHESYALAPIPRHERVGRFVGSTVRRVGYAVSLGPAMAIASCTAAAVADPDFTADAYHAVSGNKTDQEKIISDGLTTAFGTSVHVRCAKVENTSDSAERLGYTHKWPYGGLTSFVRIKESFCADIISVIGRDEPLSHPQLELASEALYVATHEAEHVAREPASESITDCYTLQDVYNVATTFGTSPEVADQLAVEGARIRSITAPPEYVTDPTLCQDGGTHDLDPSKPGYFPGSVPLY